MSDHQARLPLGGPPAGRQVISASRRTDIPAYHARWLLRRLEEGRCEVRNPFGGQVRRVDLRPEAVLALVFWTRDPTPLMPHLDGLAARGYRFGFLVTVNDYPRFLEPRAPTLERVADALHRIAGAHGPHAVVWRYDPVVLTSATPPAYHLDRVAAIAGRLAGATSRCVLSLVDLYRKTERNLEPALRGAGVELLGDDRARDLRLLSDVGAALSERGITPSLCCEPDLADASGVARARCIDRDWIAALTGERVRLPARPTREGCGCHASIDIGAYDTCARGCAYCYANASPDAGRRGAAACDPRNPRLGT